MHISTYGGVSTRRENLKLICMVTQQTYGAVCWPCDGMDDVYVSVTWRNPRSVQFQVRHAVALFLSALKNLRKATMPSVRPQGTTRLPPDGF